MNPETEAVVLAIATPPPEITIVVVVIMGVLIVGAVITALARRLKRKFSEDSGKEA